MTAPEPSDQTLYNSVKTKIYRSHPIHSAYRSGMVVKEYKKQFAAKYGHSKPPYQGRLSNEPVGLTRWFQEEWKNQRGSTGYIFLNDVYRPTRAISARTPITFEELSRSPGRLERARREKYKTGRVKRF
jgi:Family of unknown function (DUF5872)